MSNIIKLAKNILIKWADDPQIQWNEEGSQRDPMFFDERITPPGGAKQEEQQLSNVLREQLNRAMNSIRSDYETLKNIPGALTKTPSDILEAFFKIWNNVQSLQMSENIDSAPEFVATQFTDMLSDIIRSGVKTPLNKKPISISEIVDTMNKVIETSVSEFYEGSFSPKTSFYEELMNASYEIKQAVFNTDYSLG